MRFEWTEEQKAVRRRLRQFFEKELTPEVRQKYYDPEEQGGWTPEFTREFIGKMGKEGLFGIGWPKYN